MRITSSTSNPTPTCTPTPDGHTNAHAPGGTSPVPGTYYRLINCNGGKVTEVADFSTTDGGNVQQWTCGSGTNQRRQLVAVGNYYQLKAQHSGKVLDVVGNDTADDVNIDQPTWNSRNNQQWQIVP